MAFALKFLASHSSRRRIVARLNSGVSHQIMRIGSDKEHVDILVLERSPAGAPVGNIRVKVTVSLREFAGSYDSVCLERLALVEFIDRLTCLEQARSGEAELEGMSPGEFFLKVRSHDGLGHLAVDVMLQRYQRSGQVYWPTKVSGGFELEPTDLPQIVSQFQALVDG